MLEYVQDAQGEPTLDVLTERHRGRMCRLMSASLTGPPWRRCLAVTSIAARSGTAELSTCSTWISAQIRPMPVLGSECSWQSGERPLRRI